MTTVMLSSICSAHAGRKCAVVKRNKELSAKLHAVSAPTARSSEATSTRRSSSCERRQPKTDPKTSAIKKNPIIDDVISIYSMSPRQRRIPGIQVRSTTSPPGTRDDIDSLLSRSSRYFPANIPMVVNEASTPLYDIDKRANCRLQRGDVVNALYKTSGWVCVRSADEVSGYVPSHSLKPFACKTPHDNRWYEQTDSGRESSSSTDTVAQRDVALCSSCDESFFSDYDSPILHTSDDDVEPKQHYFGSDDRVLRVLYDYEAAHFDDVSVRQHEVVTSSDHGQGWIWISRASGEQGYIPKSYAVDLSTFNTRPGGRSSYF